MSLERFMIDSFR